MPLLLGLLLAAAGAARAEVWVLIDTVGHRLDVYRDYTPLLRFHGISLGRGGAALLRREGDATTPLGEFRINRINSDSRFHIFLGLDYPNLVHAQRAYSAGVIDGAEFDLFQTALMARRGPPQGTPLGGNIGIHGIGHGDPEIHRAYNWTQGCIAITNEQIEQLTRAVRVGTRVVIR